MKKLLRDRALAERGVLLERGVFPNRFIIFLSEKFSLLLEYFFLSGNYSRLLLSIDLFFHVVHLLLENDIL